MWPAASKRGKTERRHKKRKEREAKRYLAKADWVEEAKRRYATTHIFVRVTNGRGEKQRPVNAPLGMLTICQPTQVANSNYKYNAKWRKEKLYLEVIAMKLSQTFAITIK